MAGFEFSAPTQVIFGAGRMSDAGKLAASLGRRALITSGARGAGFERLREILRLAGVEGVVCQIDHEPDVELVQAGLRAAQAAGCDLVIGFGGGSAIDAGKAIAVLMTNPGDPLDYLEVVGKNQTLRVPALPMIAIPTTAGTGSEVTRNAVLAVPEEQVKVSLRGPFVLPRVALVDPELTYSLPAAVTASTGMDALTQVIEPYVSVRANPMTDLYCQEGIRRAGRSLLRVYQNGEDHTGREDMAFASLMGGLALANAGLGAVHGFAAPLGGMFAAPHGAICAALLPAVVQMNARALQARAPQHASLARYQQVAAWVTGDSDATIAELSTWLDHLRAALGIPGLGTYGVSGADIPGLVEKSAVASSMKANPIELTRDELAEILEQAI